MSSSDGIPTIAGSPAPTPDGKPTPQVPARVIGGFELIEKIGQGGMGTVFKARQISLDRVVALKVLPPSIAKDETFIKRFVREARACAKLSHPNIVLGIDVGQDEASKLWYFAMEFVDGPPLSRVLKRRKILPEKEALEVVRDVAKALECAQQHGFVHRDVKPDNILLSSAGPAKLADLGLARHTKEEASLTQSGTTVGTPFYISPEQIRGEVDSLDIRTDLYALGGTLFHLVTGQPPFDGETPPVIMAKHLSETPPMAHRVNPDVSESTSRMVQRLLQKEKDKRFQTPQELIEHIEKILAGTLTAGHRARTTGPRDAIRGTGPREAGRTTGPRQPLRGLETTAESPVSARKSAALYVTAGAMGVVVLGIGLFFALSGGGETPRPGKKPSSGNDTTPPVARPVTLPAPTAATEDQLRSRFSALLNAAQTFEKNNPGDFKASKAKYDELVAQAKGSPVEAAFVSQAEESAARIRQCWQDAADAAWEACKQKIGPLLEAGDYDAALKLCEELPPGLDELLRPKAAERNAAIRKTAEEKFLPAIEAAEAASKSAEPQKGLDELAKVEGLKFAPLGARAGELKKRLQDELANAAELDKKRVRLAAEKRLNEHLLRFDAALLEKSDLAAAREAASAAGDDAALKPLCEAQARSLDEIVKAFEDLQRREAEALKRLVGTELSLGKDKGVVKKVDGDAITVILALEGPGGKATAQKTVRASDLTAEQRAAIFRNVELPETPVGKVAGALCKLRQGGVDPVAAEELLHAAPDHPLTAHYMELARVKRLGAAEVAAEKAWPALERAAAAPCTEPEHGKALLMTLNDWQAVHGTTQFSKSKKPELDAWVSKAERTQLLKLHWIIADDADVYLNGKPLASYIPDFRTRPDEAYKPYQVDVVLRDGDVITVGGRRGGSFGITMFALSHDNRVVFRTDATHWQVYVPAAADEKRWYLPEVALRSQAKPVTVQPTPFYTHKKLTDAYKVNVECIWDAPTARTAFLYAVVGAPVAVFAGTETKPAPPAQPATRTPVPAAPALAEAERKLRDSLKEDYQKKGPTDRAALASKLLKLAMGSRNDAPVCYVMLDEAKDVAVSVGDLNTAWAAADALSSAFVVDPVDLKVSVFAAAARGMATPEAAGKAADTGHDLLEQLAGDGQYDAALRLIAPLEDLARRANDPDAAKAVQSRAKELRTQQADWNRAKPSIDKLKEEPENAEAALVAGKYYAASRGDWEHAIPLLAKSSAPAYQEAASKELARPTEADARAALGDLWFALAEREMGAMRTALQSRARQYYEDALPGLSGPAKAKVEKRIESLAATTSASAVNLMAAVDLAKDAVAGKWKADGRAVVSDTGACSRVMLPYEVPDEYDYRVELTRNTGASTVGLMLTKNGRPFVMETGWPAGWTGFAYIDGKHIDANPTGVKCPLTNGRRYTFLVQVRNTGLKLFVDGKQILAWKTDYKNFTPHSGWAFPNKQCVGFGSYLSTTTFHSAELIEVTGRGKRLR